VTDDERTLASLHEAGHAVCAYLVNGEVWGPLSIQPRKRWGAIARLQALRSSGAREDLPGELQVELASSS
jgi:ATP-dependent Zn protease